MGKIKWSVSEAPSGPYRSFEKRAWPIGEIGGEIAFSISCEDPYVPSNVRTGEHAGLRLRFADRSELVIGFNWKLFKKRFATLQEAKDFAQDFANQHPAKFTNISG